MGTEVCPHLQTIATSSFLSFEPIVTPLFLEPNAWILVLKCGCFISSEFIFALVLCLLGALGEMDPIRI